MKNDEIVLIDERKFRYNEYYKRLEAHDDKVPAVACPKCHKTKFELSYGSYEIIAHCECGHSMTVYDG